MECNMWHIKAMEREESTMPTTAMDQFAVQVGLRVKAAREAIELTQEGLSKRIGFNDRQTLAAIEAGIRKVSAEELMRFMEILGKDLEFFTDPFRLVSEARFSFRARGAGEDGLTAFEESAGQWIAFWREQGRRQKVNASPLRPQLMLTARSTFEEAQTAGENLAQEWNLGDVPAARLAAAIEERLALLILYVDMPTGISGAACQISGGDAILVNRKDPEGRRNFDVAHELFHVLTWDALPPERVDREKPKGYKAKRVEQLADNFAGALLMPRAVLEALWKARQEKGVLLQDWFAAVTAQLRVSAPALSCRLRALGFMSDADLFELNEDALVTPVTAIPPPFSRRFMERAGQAVEQANVSVMRLVKLLGTTGRGGLKEIFQTHGLAIPPGV
jgi:Zn-dependent peptidase ImmA (M78 family)/DNA-binding XRE family transcriptional regulator